MQRYIVKFMIALPTSIAPATIEVEQLAETIEEAITEAKHKVSNALAESVSKSLTCVSAVFTPQQHIIVPVS